MASITKHKDSYLIMVSSGYDTSGKQLRKLMTWKPEEGMTEKQIEKAVNEQAVLFERQVLSGQVLDGSVTFAAFTERWCKDYAESQLAPKTYDRYLAMLQRILPAIGHIRLDKLQPHHLLELYRDMGDDVNKRGIAFLGTEELFAAVNKKSMTMEQLAKKSGLHINTIYKLFRGTPVAMQTVEKVCGVLRLKPDKYFKPSKPLKVLSNKTIKHHHRLISSILNQAVYWQVIPANPAQRVKPPKVERVGAKYLDEKQTAQLLELLENESMQQKTMIKLFILSGLRRGEMCGLEWGDIDFANNMITVCRSSQYVAGKGIFTKETKTETSDRTIKLPAQAFELLREYKKWQIEERMKMGDRWQESNRIFTQHDGSPIHPDSITSSFRKFIAKTDLPKITIHSLRHTNITLMIAAGVPLRTVSFRAGHAQTSTTINLYSHAINTSDELAAEVLEDILKPKQIKNKVI